MILANSEICNDMMHANMDNRWRSLLGLGKEDAENFKDSN